jgi:hypothetical protein
MTGHQGDHGTRPTRLTKNDTKAPKKSMKDSNSLKKLGSDLMQKNSCSLIPQKIEDPKGFFPTNQRI